MGTSLAGGSLLTCGPVTMAMAQLSSLLKKFDVDGQ